MYPSVNLADYKPEATLDRVKIAVTLSRPSQHPHIQAKLHKLLDIEMVKGHCIYVEPMDKAAKGNNATKFWFELHDHQHENNASKVRHALLGLKAEYGFDAPPRTLLAEPALDLWPNKPNAAPLPELTKLVAMTLAFRGDNPRQWDPSIGKEVGLLERPEPLGTTYWINHHKTHWHNGKKVEVSDIAGRVYHKTTDTKDEDDKAIPLPPDQHRVRAEFTLRGAALKKYGLQDPLALDRFDTKAIMELFHFRKLLPPKERLKKTSLRRGTMKAMEAAKAKMRATGVPTPPEERKRLRMFERLVALLQGQRSKEPQCHVSSWPHGLIGYDPKAKGGREPRKHSIHTVPYAELNEIAQNALQTLFKKLGKGVYSSASKKRTKTS